MHASLKGLLHKWQRHQLDWEDCLPLACHMLNIHPLASVGESPYFLMKGRDPCSVYCEFADTGRRYLGNN